MLQCHYYFNSPIFAKYKSNKMKKNRFFTCAIIALLIGNFSLSAQTSWSEAIETKEAQLNILYFEQEPFTYKENEKLKGIEVEILESFVSWLKEKKGVTLKLNYKDYDSFKDVEDRIRVAVNNTVALANFTITEEREKQIDFSSPYLKNISVLLTSGYVPTAHKKEELTTNLSSYYATTIRGSLYEKHLKKLREECKLTNGEILFVGSPIAVVHAIVENARYYGYTDLITFWRFIKQSNKYIKMQKIANVEDQYYAFAFPQRSDWRFIFNEFMESGFGFTATKEYHDILKKYLGYEIIDAVAID